MKYKIGDRAVKYKFGPGPRSRASSGTGNTNTLYPHETSKSDKF